MNIKQAGPYELQTLGKTIRVVDKDGRDVALIGQVGDPRTQTYADFIKAALNAVWTGFIRE